MKVMKYLFLSKEWGFIGPQMSVCTSCKGVFALHEEILGKWRRYCLTSTHPSHTRSDGSIAGKPFTMPVEDNGLSPLKWRCPNWKCHFLDSLSISPIKYDSLSISSKKHDSLVVLRCKANIRFFDIRTRAMSYPFASLRQSCFSSMWMISPFSSIWPRLRILLFILGI